MSFQRFKLKKDLQFQGKMENESKCPLGYFNDEAGIYKLLYNPYTNPQGEV